jgi:hypothetical protein
MIKDPLIPENDQNIYCPTWSGLLGKKTTCLKENCTNFIPSQEAEGELLEGFCRKEGILDALNSIIISLGVLSGQIDLAYPEDPDAETPKEPERDLYN